MKTMRTVLALCLALIMSLSAVSALAETLEAAPSDDVVLATVNGEAILQSRVMATYQEIVDYYGYYGYDMTDPENAAAARQMAMSGVIEEVLVNQKARELGLDEITEEEMAGLIAENDGIWEEAIANYIEQATNLGDDATEEQLAAERLNAIAYYESVGYTRETTLASSCRNFISDRVMGAVVGEITVSDEDVLTEWNNLVAEDRETYQDNVLQYEYSTLFMGYPSYYRPAGYRCIYHILLKADETLLEEYTTLAARWEEQAEAQEAGSPVEDPMDYQQVEDARQAVLASAQEELDAVRAELEAGADFLEVADRYSTDTYMLTEPYRSMGNEVHRESVAFEPEYIAAAFGLAKPGDFSGPVVSYNGVYLLYYAKDLPEVEDPTEADLAEIRAYLEEDLTSSAYTAVVDGWFGEAEIVYTEAGEPWRLVEAVETGDDE